MIFWMILSFLLTIIVLLLPIYIRFSGSAYQGASGNGFLKTLFDKVNYGEFLIFHKLERLQGHHKLMTNLYIPKEDSTTTEIDVMLLAETGIYVFESKNYSGWIFGNEKQKYWTQTLQNKRKNKFFNPIWQNKAHINALSNVLNLDDTVPYKSYIIFSERCTLKKVSVASKNVKVIKRNSLLKQMKKDFLECEKVLSEAQINSIHKELSDYCLADEKVKQAHIEAIKSR